MERPINVELYSEVCQPERRIIRSDLLLYVLVVIGAMAFIFVTTFIIALLELPALIAQLTQFAILLVCGWRLYRTRLISYRYTLTARMFSIDRVTGKRIKPDMSVHLSDITSVRQYGQLASDEGGKRENLYLGRKEYTTAVTYRVAGTQRTMLLSMTDEMRKQLVAQWKIARK